MVVASLQVYNNPVFTLINDVEELCQLLIDKCTLDFKTDLKHKRRNIPIHDKVDTSGQMWALAFALVAIDLQKKTCLDVDLNGLKLEMLCTFSPDGASSGQFPVTLWVWPGEACSEIKSVVIPRLNGGLTVIDFSSVDVFL